MELHPADAKRILDALVWASHEAVERHGNAESNSAHRCSTLGRETRLRSQ